MHNINLYTLYVPAVLPTVKLIKLCMRVWLSVCHGKSIQALMWWDLSRKKKLIQAKKNWKSDPKDVRVQILLGKHMAMNQLNQLANITYMCIRTAYQLGTIRKYQ